MSEYSGFSEEERAEIVEHSLIWEASLERDRLDLLAGCSPPVVSGVIQPRELLVLVNRIRAAQGLRQVEWLSLRYTKPQEPTKCFFAAALQCMATYDELVFLSRDRAEGVSRALGVPTVKTVAIETPEIIMVVMGDIDIGKVLDQDLQVPLYEQLSLDRSAVTQAEQVLADAERISVVPTP